MKPQHRLFVVTLILGWLSFGASAEGFHHQGDRAPFAVEGGAESILGMRYTERGLEFQVPSTGCTEKEDFAVQRFSLDGQLISQLLLIRVEPDYCDAYVPFGVWISFDYQELGVEEDYHFSVLNPRMNYRVPVDGD